MQAGIADPKRLGIGGWSYGCIMTNYTIATDTRFRAATCGAGSALQLSMYGSDQYIVQYEQEIGAPWANPEAWKDQPPVLPGAAHHHADAVSRRERDFNVPIIGG